MAKINGGIIGPNNPTGPFSAGGVWRLEDAFNAQKAGTWPIALGYQIPNSLRFNSGSSDYLSRTPASTTNQRTWTYSFWIKRTVLGTTQYFLYARNDDNNRSYFRFNSTDTLGFFATSSASVKLEGTITSRVFRDVSAWYHIVLSADTTQATSSNRFKIYVNGTEQTLTFDTTPSQNSDLSMNIAYPTAIGVYVDGLSGYLNGYMSEVYMIDGQQLTPSSFGQTDSTTGIWTPIAYTGTYGTNGFYLNFANSADLGNDVSGNNNDFTVNNLTSIDQSYDSPTNNFATMNPLSNVSVTITEGNLKGSGTGDYNFRSTFAVNKGKWYWEVKLGADGGVWGICNENVTMATDRSSNAGVYGIQNAGTTYAYKRDNGTTAESAGFPNPVSGNIMNMAFDADNAKLYIGINGTYYNLSGTTGNPATGSNATYSSIDTSLLWLAFCEFRGAGQSCELNFGYPPFTISSGNADANGFGNFEYAVPSGYYALCSKNLAIYG